MNKLPNVPWWSLKASPTPDPSPDTDYADMGTAFGLDASLTPKTDGDAKPADADAADADAADAEPARPVDRLNGRSVI